MLVLFYLDNFYNILTSLHVAKYDRPGIVWNWKYSLDLLFKSTEIFSGHVTLGQQIFGSKVESCEGGQWELLEKSRDNAFRKFKIYSDRMGLIYPANKLPADLCAGPVIFRCALLLPVSNGKAIAVTVSC